KSTEFSRGVLGSSKTSSQRKMGSLKLGSVWKQLSLPWKLYILGRRLGRSMRCVVEAVKAMSQPGKGKRFIISNHRHFQRGGRFRMNATLDVGGAVKVINDLGLDTFTFLAVIVLVVLAFKFVKASPVVLCTLSFTAFELPPNGF
ncbi:hypothetical protein Tco_1348953, partial [Tanacetum coccineum]